MTSLIDVIFLLLLFFMLTSTFSRFSEVDLPLAGAGTPQEAAVFFLRVGEDTMSLNGQTTDEETLRASVIAAPQDKSVSLIVSTSNAASAQKLVDILGAVRSLERLSITLLGGK